MLRIVTKQDNAGMAANCGGSVLSTLKTFDIELPEVEAYLKSFDKDTYSHVQVIGVEVLPGD
jgi:hypothetical protein